MKRWQLGILAILLLGSILAGVLLTLAVMGPQQTESVPADRKMPIGELTHTPVATPTPRPAAPTPDPVDPAESEIEQAMFTAVAAVAGEGFILCEIGGTPKMRYSLHGHPRSRQLGSGLRVLVSESAGSGVVWDAGDVVAVAFWSDAWPGEQGHCRVESPRILEHRVAIDGLEAGMDPKMIGCDEATLDGDTIVVRSFAGVACTLKVLAVGGSGSLEILADEPSNDLTVTLSPLSPEDLIAKLGSMMEERQMTVMGVNPVEAASKEPDLPPEVRRALADWAASESRAESLKAQQNATLQEGFENAKARMEQNQGED